MAILVTKDLCKTYGSGDNAVHALNHVSLTVGEGEFVSIVGTSGSGKSTLLNLVGGLDKPTSGEVWVRSHDLGKLNDEQLTIFRRRNIGFVFQNFNTRPALRRTAAAGGNRPCPGHQAGPDSGRRAHRKSGQQNRAGGGPAAPELGAEVWADPHHDHPQRGTGPVGRPHPPH